MHESVLLTGGLILVAGAVAGALARVVRLPTITGYMAAGILLGPYVLDRIPHGHGEALARPVTELTMALVLFVLGGQFRLDKIRGKERPTLILSVVESVVTFVLVSAAAWPLMGSVAGGVLLGVMAVAVAPATTLAVLQEYQAEGPIAEGLQLLTALSNVWSIFFFEVTLLVLVALQGGEARADALAWAVAGSLVYGLVAGHALILFQERLGFGSYALPLLTTLLVTIGVCQLTDVPSMLVFLVTGSVVVNRSRFFEPIVEAMESYARPAYVAFFVLSGWHLDFELLAGSGLLVGAYVICRSVGKVAGAKLGLRMGRLRFDWRGSGQPPLGLGLLSQAGAAIALAHLAKSYDPELGTRLLNVVLGAVVVFELVGPLLVKRLVITAGEVRLGQLLLRPGGAGPSRTWLEAVRRMVQGATRRERRAPDALTVRDVMRAGTKPLSARATMDDMLRYANHSRFNQFPVVDDNNELVGMIRLKDLYEFVYDPQAAALVIAADLTSIPAEKACLAMDMPLEQAAAFLDDYPGNTVAVVDDTESRRFRGVLERAEVLRVMRHARQ